MLVLGVKDCWICRTFLWAITRQRGTALDIKATPSWLDFIIDQGGMVKETIVFTIKALNDNFETAKLFNMQESPAMQKFKKMGRNLQSFKNSGQEEKAKQLYNDIIEKSLSLRRAWDNSASDFADWQANNPNATIPELAKAKNRFFRVKE